MFEYAVEDVVAMNFRLLFGWRSSPRFWGLVVSALEHTTFRGAVVSARAQGVAAHVWIAKRGVTETTLVPPGCGVIVGSAGGAGDTFFRSYYVDDEVFVVSQRFKEGCRCTAATRSLVSDLFCLLG